MPIKGVERVRKALRQKMKNIEDKTTASVLYQIGIEAAGWAALLTPIDSSNLVNSMYSSMKNTPYGATLILGYTARYAKWVHDSSGKLAGQKRANGNGKYWEPNAEPEFLKKAFEQNMDAIWRIIERGYRI